MLLSIHYSGKAIRGFDFLIFLLRLAINMMGFLLLTISNGFRNRVVSELCFFNMRGTMLLTHTLLIRDGAVMGMYIRIPLLVP